jgi:hypothetical protein
MLHGQTGLLGTFAKCSQREKNQMTGHFEPSPTTPEPPVPKTAHIRRGYNKTASIGTEPPSALAQQIDRINGVLNHVIESNYIVLHTFRYI